MEEFRRRFLTETVETLENLKQTLRPAGAFSDSTKGETFRVFHTVKGTAQTFGFGTASRLAHELETLLSADGNTHPILIEGIELLQKSLAEKAFTIPEQFTKKLRALVPNDGQTLNRRSDQTIENSVEVPVEIYSQLSQREKNLFGSAVRTGKKISVLEISFKTADFAAQLIKFRGSLNLFGEIIATFPSAKAGGGIGFRFLTASSEAVEDWAKANSANVGWNFSPDKSADGIGEVFRQITRHGAEVAVRLNKQIEIETQSDAMDFSPAELKLVFEVLLHLVRNAVDHAVERVGKIKIQIKKEPQGFRLSVADDGRGIDFEKVKAAAIEKKLVSAAENITEAETIELIFQTEFSTKSESDEISGRGIGLDVVKYAVEKSGGKLSVATAKGKGTTFDVFLPRKESEVE